MSDTKTCNRTHTVLILDNELGMGGLEKKLFDFVSRVDKAHFRIVVCCLKQGGYFKEAFMGAGAPFYEGILKHRYDLMAYRHLVRIIKQEGVDLIYTFLHPNTVVFAHMARVTRLVKALIVSVHATGSPTGGRLVRPFQKPFLGVVDRFIAVADSHRDYLSSREGLPADKVVVIHNGVDTEKYSPGEPRAALARELGLENAGPVITTVASLNERKGIDVLLGAFARIRERQPGAALLLVGDGPEREKLRAMALGLGIGDGVVFAGIRDDIDEILRLSDLFVLPSRPGTETFPNVVLEAMASALPVVATDVGSVGELAADGESALLVPPEDGDRLYGAMEKMLSDKKLRRRFGERGREIVLEKFDLGGMCAKREQLFSELLCTHE